MGIVLQCGAGDGGSPLPLRYERKIGVFQFSKAMLADGQHLPVIQKEVVFLDRSDEAVIDKVTVVVMNLLHMPKIYGLIAGWFFFYNFF